MSVLTKNVNNALVWYEAPQRWLDAVGQNVVKYLTHYEYLPFADADQLDGWTSTIVEGAGQSTVAVTTVKGGRLLITTGTNEDDGINMTLDGLAFQLNAMQPLYYGVKFQVDVTTQVDYWVGLTVTDTDILAGVTDGIGFRKVDGTTTVNFVIEKNSNETLVAVDTAVAATDVTYEFYYDGINVYVYVDGILQATVLKSGNANFPDDMVLTPSFHLLSGVVTTTDEMSIDWLRVIQCQ
ncbi:hypothetical protein LCGC14_0386730 [marine sediment metagenome]|uniref:LamG-like jellyroll fold domain-containing protein n=1 Tax=marine sediment metagenome TaxID=412755 RepID=A0A0F9T0M1_9ZZZZ